MNKIILISEGRVKKVKEYSTSYFVLHNIFFPITGFGMKQHQQKNNNKKQKKKGKRAL